MPGRPRIRDKVWDRAVKCAEDEGREPSELVEDAIELYLAKNVRDGS